MLGAPQMHERETRKRSQNRNPTGFRMGRKKGLSPGCPPPVLKDKLRLVGELSGGRKFQSGRRDASQD